MEIIGSYELTKRLGSGTFGTVWLARNQATGWLRAIKLANDPQVVHQFKTEAATLDRLRHPHIVQVYEFIDDADRPGIIFEYIEGGDLSKRLKEGPLPWQEAVRIALETLEALQAAHGAGLIHRDIKPSNILVTDEGHVKVADFGLVSAAERAGSLLVSQEEGGTSSIAGTAHYMAPEYDEGARPSPQADLFSLGVVLYQCLTGKLPRGAVRLPSQLVDDCPESLDGAVMALLEVDPGDRPTSAGEAYEMLSSALQEGLRAQQEARERQEAEERRAREAEEQREKEAAAAQARREREAREAREQRERATADRGASGGPVSPLLRDRRLHIAAAMVAAVVVVAGILSSALRDRETPPDPKRVAQATSGMGKPEGESSGDARSSPGSRAGEETTGADGGTYVWVPPGEFMMGSERYDEEKPVHRVRITRGFWLGKHEVTNAQYRAFCEATGKTFPEKSAQGDDQPVVYVSWSDAKDYCDQYRLALPTEAQWEYAARGPEGHKYLWGGKWDSKKCCNTDNRGPGGSTFPVGSFPDGASWCGALDMAGNVWEWCSDWYDKSYYASSPETDPAGPATGGASVVRGGGWGLNAGNCRTAYRDWNGPAGQNSYYGFRPVVPPR